MRGYTPNYIKIYAKSLKDITGKIINTKLKESF